MKFKITFLLIIFFGLGLYYFVHNGFYPVAIVNNRLISAGLFDKKYQTALIYYQNAIKVYNGQNLSEVLTQDFINELRRATLDNLIENTLIYSELKRKLGREVGEIVENKIPAFKESAVALYGLTGPEFKELVLAPQAHREILEGRFNLENEDFENWLIGARKSARVYLLLSGFSWNGLNVVTR